MSTYEWITAIANITMALFSVFAAIAAFIAYMQYKKQLKDTQRENDYEKKKFACELARYFETEILPLLSFIVTVERDREKTALSDAEKVFPLSAIRDFDRNEMTELLNAAQKDYSYVKDRLENAPAKSILSVKLAVSRNVSDHESILAYYGIIHTDKPETEKDIKEKADKEAMLRQEYRSSITKVLNKLEWFSMNFHYGIADENVVYQSLHDVFISTVCAFYWRIADRNTTNPQKVFTNIIWLFNLWRDRLALYQKEQRERDRESKTPIHEAAPVE